MILRRPTMTRLGRRQLLTVTLLGAIFWLFLSVYIFVNVGLPSGVTNNVRSKHISRYLDDHNSKSPLYKFLLQFRKRLNISAKLHSTLIHADDTEFVMTTGDTDEHVTTFTTVGLVENVENREFDNTGMLKLSHLFGLTNVNDTEKVVEDRRLIRRGWRHSHRGKMEELAEYVDNEDYSHHGNKTSASEYRTPETIDVDDDVETLFNSVGKYVSNTETNKGIEEQFDRHVREAADTMATQDDITEEHDVDDLEQNADDELRQIESQYNDTATDGYVRPQQYEINSEDKFTNDDSVMNSTQQSDGRSTQHFDVNVNEILRGIDPRNVQQQNDMKESNDADEETELVHIKNYNVRHLAFDPDDPGEDGDPLLTMGEDREIADQSWKDFSFNDYISGRISLERSIPDTRNAACRDKLYDYTRLPRTSVIICFVNESWSVLMRSVHSVINRTPPELLHEILLVDDFSNLLHLGQPLDDYIAANQQLSSVVRVIRLPTRHGLVRARLAAVNQTTGDVITFLDSHVECNVGWLEPLLVTIATDRHTVASPIIDTINAESFQYVATSDDLRGGFSWNMQFIWRPVPPYKNGESREPTEPIKTPTVAGGLLSIDRQWFNYLGGYDPGLDVWGAENLELSFKTWMCGGQLVIAPCSRVGHVFRNTPPYSFPGPAGNDVMTAARNNGRVADVWMDDYGELFFRRYPFIRAIINTGEYDIAHRHELRQTLQCHSFTWYLDTVYPEQYRPSLNPAARGDLRHTATGLCMDLDPVGRLAAHQCHRQSTSQYFQLTRDGRLEHVDWCIGSTGNTVHAVDCQWKNSQLMLVHRGQMDTLMANDDTRQCITLENKQSQDAWSVVLANCDLDSLSQSWTFQEYF